jgi:tetratricopeptide (TPR) repeat protein
MGALMLLGLLHTWRASRGLPSLKDISLTPLNELLEQGEPTEAVRELRMASQFFADPAMTNELITLAGKTKDLDSRIWGTRRLIEIGGARDVDTFNRLSAMLLKRAGAFDSTPVPATSERELDLREALRWSEKAARLEPENAPARYHQGLACAFLGERDQAVAHLTQAVRLDQDLRPARQALAMLTGEGARQ